jgi:hypothetical protein
MLQNMNNHQQGNKQRKARNAIISSRLTGRVVSNVEVQIITGRLNAEGNLSR